ncbi:NAD-dependent epimerase/dehydratase family protein [Alteromonas sp. a30]|uniref:NAD-dependent epimerase/dehydratase family protein n=1 Tax=Alteromonas sp. a30 TaxID=2730917 RepID=UPI0022824132|nr:NAD-dependent epimerase/dehydratase family protein [Alteromonas sp. a30]MCY7296636.1 NAD-dependent epimerase/dehydratase family protein [Alteromonas sp. a30]
MSQTTGTLKRILVTGAAGSLGKRLVERLINKQGNHVYATDIKPCPFSPKEEQAGALQYQRYDLRSPDFLEWVRQINPCQIVHLASVLQLSPSINRHIAYDIDVVATKRLLEVSTELGVDKFIITTSGAAYGYYPENRDIITESRPTRGNIDYFYSAHKAEIEALMTQYRRYHPELKQIVFRPGAILGPNFEGPVVNLFQQKLITGLMGYPGPFNFIWSEDVVSFIMEGLETDITGQFNMAGDGILTMKQIAQHLKKAYLPLPEWFIKFALSIARPLGLSQYGPEQTKFIKFRPVLDNSKLKSTFSHQLQYNTVEALDAFLKQQTQKELA